MSKIANAKKEMDAYRILMRTAKDAKAKAEYKRDFRKARNRYHDLMNEFKESF